MSRYAHRGTVLLLLALHLGGCTTWRPTIISPTELIKEEQPRRIRVQGSEGRPIVVQRPRVENDAIVVSEQCRRVEAGGGRYVCPTREIMSLDDVRTVEVRRISVGRTVLAALVLVPIALYVMAPSCDGKVGLCRDR